MEVQEFVSLAPWTMIFQICNLLILALLLKKFLFKPVQNILNRRQKEIDDMYAAADSDRSSAAQMKAEYTQKMSSARAEADRLVHNAAEEAERRSEAILTDAQQSVSMLKQRATEEIENERRSAYESLRGEIAGIAVDIAEKVVEREISAKDQNDLVDDFLKNAGDDK